MYEKIALQFNKITTYFMRTFLLCILMGFIILFIFLIKVRLNADNSKFKPTRQVDSSWICANPNIEFTVKEGKCFGELKLNEKTVNVKVLFGPGLDYSMTVNDYDAIVINDFKYDSKTELFSGYCKFSEKNVLLL